MTSPALREGIHEHLLTRILDSGLAAAAPARAELGDIARADLPAWLSRHFARELEGVLRDASTEESQLALG